MRKKGKYHDTTEHGTLRQICKVSARGLCLILWLTLCSFSLTGPSQKVSMKLGRTTIQKALNEYQRLTNQIVVFSNQDLKVDRPVNGDFTDAEPREFFTRVLAGSGLTYKQVDDYILIVPDDTAAKQQAPSTTVTGEVVDTDGKPLVGVTVRIKGGTAAVATDASGRFSITAPNNANATLVFSYIGKQTQEVVIGSRSHLRVEMQDSTQKIDEVVVTGIVDRKAESFTGSAITMKGDDLRRVGNGNVFQSMKNLDPTIYFPDNIQMGSDPNTLPDMMMRGRTGIEDEPRVENLKGNYQNKPNQPLFILDGFEASAERIFDLDMNTIESLTILKDAAAKALYGSKAANGVVVIETKRLNASKPRVTYTGSLDIMMPDLSSYDLLNAREKLDLEYDYGVFDDNVYDDMNRYVELRRQVSEGLDTYWLSKPVRFGYGHKHWLAVELGKDELRTMVSFGYNDVKGVMKKSDRTNISGNVNIEYRLKNLLFRNDFNINNNNSSDSPWGTFSEYVALNPYENPYDELGFLKQKLSDGTLNPMSNGHTKTKLLSGYTTFTDNFSVEWTVVEGLRLRARFGISHKTNSADRFYTADHNRYADINDLGNKGEYEVNHGKELLLSGDFYVNYARTFAEKHNIFINAGFNLSDKDNREVIHYTKGFLTNKMEDIMFALSYKENSRPLGDARTTRELGLLAIASYTYDDRYLLDATLRGNAASMFGSDNRWGSFWSLGVGWNLHNEPFMKDVKWMKRFKLRASMGLTGNQNFGSTLSQAIYEYRMSDRYGQLLGSVLKNMENPKLKWEKKMDYNIGFDADLFGLSVRFDIYNSLSENRVSTMSISPTTGFSSVSTNFGSVRNKGIEAYLAYTIISGKNGFLTVNASVVYNKNRLVEISEDLQNMDSSYTKGEDMSAIKAVYSYGVDPATGLEMFRKADGSRTYEWHKDDRIILGVEDPKYRGVVGISGEYKGLGVTLNMRFMGGGQMMNNTLMTRVDMAPIKQNLDRRVLEESWMAPNDKVNYIRRIPGTPYRYGASEFDPESTNSAPSITQPTSRFIQDRKEFDISSVSLYYDLRREWISKLGMERMRVSVFMNDVWKWSSMGIERGISYPFARTLSFQLSCTF